MAPPPLPSNVSMPPPPPPGSMPPPPVPDSAANGSNSLQNPDDYKPQMTDGDLSAIRSRYLGVDKKKRKIRKMNDRKFVFDWDEQDDTGAGASFPVVMPQHSGHIAGMDGGGAARKNGAMELADPLERRKAAKSGLDERHWTEKSLDEMKERDWRIFREDFSIAARGV